MAWCLGLGFRLKNEKSHPTYYGVPRSCEAPAIVDRGGLDGNCSAECVQIKIKAPVRRLAYHEKNGKAFLVIEICDEAIDHLGSPAGSGLRTEAYGNSSHGW